MTTIFLSSTYEDLNECRQVVFDALKKSGHTVIAGEDYVATDQRLLDIRLKDIAERADIYIGIFAFRYGYIPPTEHIRDGKYTAQHDDWQGLSITELEFRYAREIGLPCLIFVAKDGTPWNPAYIDAYAERNKKEHPGDRIDQLREYLLKEKLASEFTTPYQLASLVQAALAKHFQSSGKQRAEKETVPTVYDRPLFADTSSIQIQLTIDEDCKEFKKEQLHSLLTNLEDLLNLPGGIHLDDIANGSVVVTLRMPLDQAEQLLWLYRRGVLKDWNIKDARIIGDAAAAAILENKLESGDFDVFMCHNSEDKAAVKKIGVRLRNVGILPWIDEWELRPGVPWQKALEEQIKAIKSAAIFVGNSGIGPWQDMELSSFIRQFVKRQCPVIPVILSSCIKIPSLPSFLDGMTWVNFKKNNPNPYHQLIWGITGKKVDFHVCGQNFV